MNEPSVEEVKVKGQITENPEDVIMAIRQEVYMMGANDYEIPAINAILERFQKGQCSAEEAIAEAMKIKQSKQNYH